MPFNFTGDTVQATAKFGVVSDGSVFTSDGYNGHTVTYANNQSASYSVFKGVPTRSATGVWSVTLKEVAYAVCLVDVKTVLTTGNYLSTQLLPTTTESGTGKLVLNWVFNVAGTPTDIGTSQQFEVFVMYSERSLS